MGGINYKLSSWFRSRAAYCRTILIVKNSWRNHFLEKGADSGYGWPINSQQLTIVWLIVLHGHLIVVKEISGTRLVDCHFPLRGRIKSPFQMNARYLTSHPVPCLLILEQEIAHSKPTPSFSHINTEPSASQLFRKYKSIDCQSGLSSISVRRRNYRLKKPRI